MLKHRLIAVAIALLACAAPAAAQEKLILDSDYTTIGDDGQVGVMAIRSASMPTPSTRSSTTSFDNKRFFRLYVDLLTRPVPVQLRRTN